MASTPYIDAGAMFDRSGTYRYALWRTWAPLRQDMPRGQALWVGANPSRAGADEDDHTLGCIVRFSMAFGLAGIWLGNCLGYVSTDPTALLFSGDPVGPDNDFCLAVMAANCDMVIACWGEIPDRRRTSEVVSLLQRTGKGIWCLGTTKSGAPRHPSRLAADTPLEIWKKGRR